MDEHVAPAVERCSIMAYKVTDTHSWSYDQIEETPTGDVNANMGTWEREREYVCDNNFKYFVNFVTPQPQVC